MKQSPPRQAISELVMEGDLVKKILVVEGNHDKKFFERWAMLAGLKIRVEIIDNVDVPNDVVEQHELCSGARSRILVGATIAEQTHEGRQFVRFIADRDMGQNLEEFESCPCLLITDYPAIESYGMSKDVIDWFNSDQCNNRLRMDHQIYSDLCGVLYELYEYRKCDPHREGPNYESGAKKKSEIKDFDSAKAFGYHNGVDSPTKRVVAKDPRPYAYGHDIIGVLYHVYRTEFKLEHYEDFGKAEKDFRGSILDVGAHKDEKMFRDLWAFFNGDDRRDE
ncbi:MULTISPECIES: hypothetical protein [Actinomyces]|nr:MULTISPECIES: hypothetical protein [Actinomyces]